MKKKILSFLLVAFFALSGLQVFAEAPVFEDLNKVTSVEVSGTSSNEFALRILELVNQYREKNNVEPLEYDWTMQEQADLRAMEIALSYNHERLDGSESMYSENITGYQTTPEAVVNAWIKSEGHRVNMVSPSHKSMALGAFKGPRFDHNPEKYMYALLFSQSEPPAGNYAPNYFAETEVTKDLNVSMALLKNSLDYEITDDNELVLFIDVDKNVADNFVTGWGGKTDLNLSSFNLKVKSDDIAKINDGKILHLRNGVTSIEVRDRVYNELILEIPLHVDDMVGEEEIMLYYVINKNSKVFHRPTCPSVSMMKEKNKQEVRDSFVSLVNLGYKPCERCLHDMNTNVHVDFVTEEENVEKPDVTEPTVDVNVTNPTELEVPGPYVIEFEEKEDKDLNKNVIKIKRIEGLPEEISLNIYDKETFQVFAITVNKKDGDYLVKELQHNIDLSHYEIQPVEIKGFDYEVKNTDYGVEIEFVKNTKLVNVELSLYGYNPQTFRAEHPQLEVIFVNKLDRSDFVKVTLEEKNFYSKQVELSKAKDYDLFLNNSLKGFIVNTSYQLQNNVPVNVIELIKGQDQNIYLAPESTIDRQARNIFVEGAEKFTIEQLVNAQSPYNPGVIDMERLNAMTANKDNNQTITGQPVEELPKTSCALAVK